MRKFLVLLAAGTFLCAIPSRAQDDSQSLGDVARQARAQKQQKDSQPKDASTKDAPKDAATASAKTDPTKTDTPGSAADSKSAPQPKTAHVITNEELPEHTASAAAAHHSDSKETATEPPSGDRDAQAEQWKSQILAQKNTVASLQREIAEISDSIHYAGGNCVANCAQWNERQQQKQSQVDSMKAQLEEQQHRLEEMQDSARKQGFGSSVYEP